MRVLISFCNSRGNVKSNLLLLDASSGEEGWLSISTGSPGITGIAQDGENFYVLSQLAITQLIIINKYNFKNILVKNLKEVRDPHSLAVINDNFFIVSSGTDQVLRYKYNKDRNDIIFDGVYWSPEDSKQEADTHHLNSICTKDKNIFVCAFGPKTGDRWSSARNGYIHDVASNRKIIDQIYHPHSVLAKGKAIIIANRLPGA